MTDLTSIVEIAFRLHDESRISHQELVSIVEQCVNIVAIENGYADEHGLPFPDQTAEEELLGAP